MKTAAVILNYNDSASAVRAARNLLPMKNIDRILIVDNASEDHSAEEIGRFLTEAGEQEREKLLFLRNERNGGYGYGNNRGVEAAEKEGCELTLILNPDTVFGEETVNTLIRAMEDPDIAAAGGLCTTMKETDCAFPLLDFREELLFSGPVLKRLFRSRTMYPESYFRSLPSPAGAVHGSLLMVRNSDFLKAGGFDERFFLFYEEKTIGMRFRELGKTVLLTNAPYAHAGSETMKKNGMDLVKRQKERQRSERLYYRLYLDAGAGELFLASLVQAAVLLETKALALLRKGSGRNG